MRKNLEEMKMVKIGKALQVLGVTLPLVFLAMNDDDDDSTKEEAVKVQTAEKCKKRNVGVLVSRWMMVDKSLRL